MNSVAHPFLLPSTLFIVACQLAAVGRETLPPLEDGEIPRTVEELWNGFDPRAEPLDVEILHEWEEEGVAMQVLRYRIGVFKGRTAMMAAVWGHPKGAAALPGLVQIHGGGQYADHRAVLTNAKRGYATISISWAGRVSTPGYRVTPKEVALFWAGATNDPAYRVTTDWGALDAYHAPGRHKGNVFPKLPEPADWTLDPVVSPRNNSWFLCALGARRALTFLERQPQVDGDRLGVYGHSMGGKLTVLTTGADARVKACAPSCGGVSDRTNDNPLFRATIGDDAYLRRIRCPILFLSPANDFHGRINDLQAALTEIQATEWRVTCSPHHNHQDTAAYEVATQLWFDQHLKRSFALPATPVTELKLRTAGGVPRITVRPDTSREILSVDVFHTQQGQNDGGKDDRDHTINRHWHHAEAVPAEGAWTAELPVLDTDRPLWVYANVHYKLDAPIRGAGYYYGEYNANRFNLSSRMDMVAPEELRAAGVKPTLAHQSLIESFEGDWEKEWFTYRPAEWGRRTHKVHEPQWAAPEHAKLTLEARAAESNQLVVGIDEHAVEIAVAGGGAWQRVTLAASDFRDVENRPLPNWIGIKELRLAERETLRQRRGGNGVRRLGGTWKGPAPTFRDLRWIDP